MSILFANLGCNFHSMLLFKSGKDLEWAEMASCLPLPGFILQSLHVDCDGDC